jgi:uncharacterized protein
VLALSLLLFAGACVGHAVLTVGTHNWFYGLPLPKNSGKFIHLVFGLATVAGPALWLWFFGPNVLAWLQTVEWTSWGQLVLAAYLAVCMGAGMLFFPWITVRRLLRRPSSAETATQSRIVNVAEKLGYAPVGRGKRSYLAQLPGNEVCTLEMVERTLRLPRLPPSLDGLTVLHLSDLHLCGTPDRHYYRIVMQQCAEWEPDLVCITGDIADSIHHQGWIVPALGWLRWKVGAFAILGNHDYWYDPPFIRRRLTRLGIVYLGNSWQRIEVRGEPLVLVGHEGPWAHPAPDLTNCPAEPFRLCLSHTPDNIAWARRQRMDLMLSGHVHGGQIRFPILGSLLVPSRYGRRYDCGTFDESPTFLHVSRGLGGEHPLRYGCRPEATLLRLVK